MIYVNYFIKKNGIMCFIKFPKGGEVMKQGLKNFFPAFLSFLHLLFFEIVNNIDFVTQNLKIDVQTISNILLLILGIYSILCIVVEMKQSHNNLEVHYLNNFLIVASAFVLNIYIFENKVVRILDFFAGWHAVWSIWFIILILWVTGIGKSAYDMIKNTIGYLGDGVNYLRRWLSDAIKNTHKGVVFSVVLGMVLWFAFLVSINIRRQEISIEEVFKESLVFWCGWFIICMLIFFFANFSTKVRQAVEELKTTNILKFFMWSVIGAIILFVILQVFPSIFPTLGNILFFPILILLLERV